MDSSDTAWSTHPSCQSPPPPLNPTPRTLALRWQFITHPTKDPYLTHYISEYCWEPTLRQTLKGKSWLIGWSMWNSRGISNDQYRKCIRSLAGKRKELVLKSKRNKKQKVRQMFKDTNRWIWRGDTNQGAVLPGFPTSSYLTLWKVFSCYLSSWVWFLVGMERKSCGIIVCVRITLIWSSQVISFTPSCPLLEQSNGNASVTQYSRLHYSVLVRGPVWNG